MSGVRVILEQYILRPEQLLLTHEQHMLAPEERGFYEHDKRKTPSVTPPRLRAEYRLSARGAPEEG
jgi:hypothetical protein